MEKTFRCSEMFPNERQASEHAEFIQSAQDF
jgi:hypothetical protein